MNKQSIRSFLDKTYCRSNGNIYHEYLLLGALCGLTLSKSAIKRSGSILYVRNDMMLSGECYLINTANCFRFMDKPSESLIKGILENIGD